MRPMKSLRGEDGLRIFWQSFVDMRQNAPYLERLSTYLNSIAAPGTTVAVHGTTPPARDFGRLSELRCAIMAIENAIAAEEAGYEAFVMGHFQDPALYEVRSTVRIPVVGAGESTLLAASQLGRRLGLVTLDQVFEVWHLEQAERYGLGGRIAQVVGMGCKPEDFAAAFAGDMDAKRRMLADFEACARPLVAAGADVVVPAGVLPGLLIGSEHNLQIDGAPVINCAAVALKNAEMWVQLRAINGVEPSRRSSFTLAPERARTDFRNLIASRDASKTGVHS